ncbi:MAG: amino acid racemase [Propionibacteriaceae bacterium]|jgi:aspartate racemase|nr:amino acid racemase [Propionibacteriaceae bacterium]
MTLHTLGLIGGITYHSTVNYYMGINNGVAAACGGHNSAPLIISSLNFQQVRGFQMAEDWEGAADFLTHHGSLLRDAGAEAIVICANLMHRTAPRLEASLDIPVLHIVDAISVVARERGLSSMGIMGTGWTMREPFYADRLQANGIRPVRASDDDIAITDTIVFDELTQGIVREESRAQLLGVVDRLAEAGADGVILGCTEIPMIISQADSDVPLIDSTQAHVAAAVNFVLSDVEKP